MHPRPPPSPPPASPPSPTLPLSPALVPLSTISGWLAGSSVPWPVGGELRSVLCWLEASERGNDRARASAARQSKRLDRDRPWTPTRRRSGALASLSHFSPARQIGSPVRIASPCSGGLSTPWPLAMKTDRETREPARNVIAGNPEGAWRLRVRRGAPPLPAAPPRLRLQAQERPRAYETRCSHASPDPPWPQQPDASPSPGLTLAPQPGAGHAPRPVPSRHRGGGNSGSAAMKCFAVLGQNIALSKPGLRFTGLDFITGILARGGTGCLASESYTPRQASSRAEGWWNGVPDLLPRE